MSNPERVVQIFGIQSLLHNNYLALYQYVKALGSLDRLDESLRLQR
jgi:ATP-dependent metalloprotease